MTELKTPYLDREIQEYKEWIAIDPDATKGDVLRLQEYQSIKEALKELEAVKEELEVTNQALDQAIYKADKAQAENERLWEFVREFYQSDIGELKTIARLEEKAQQLLKEKE